MAEEKFTGEKKVSPVNEVNKGKKGYKITYTRNNTYELKVGREIYRFEGSVSHTVPENVVKHPDFLRQASYFSITEVK